MPEERVVLNVRLPADLHAEVKRIAEREDRSLNAQIIRFLREGAERYEAPRPKPESAE
jgi:predicted HicB family RNase H-like nuclease